MALEIRGTTRILGLMGDPVTYTLSPKMHNDAFASLGLDFAYLPFVVKPNDLKDAVSALRSLNIAGVNVTIPHKQAILPYLDHLSPLAEKIGAVNTVVNKNGKLVGHNTDAPGFLSSLKEDGKFEPKGKRAVILGCGGTAHAMAIALLDEGVKGLVVMNRTFERAKNFVEHLKKIYGKKEMMASKLTSENLVHHLKESELFLNATPTGIDSAGISVKPEHFLNHDQFIFDAVYAKITPLLLAAKKMGAPYLGGLGMLIHQGALSFSLWTGEKPPVGLMKKSLEGISL